MNWLTNLIFGNDEAVKQTSQQTQHLRESLNFAKQQQQQLRDKQNEHERWQRHYGALHIDELKLDVQVFKLRNTAGKQVS